MQKNGKMLSSNNYENGIVIDDSVLSKFKLIKEGQFNEISGDPTLKIIGNLSLQTDTEKFALSTNLNSVLNPNKTYPYRYIDILNKMKKEGLLTKDGKILSDKVSYHRIRFYIENNNLNKGLENMYYDEIGNRKTYSDKVYTKVKHAFENMTLNEIENYKLNKPVE